jgi:hypothetical protein
VLRSEVVGSRKEFSPHAHQVYGPKLVATRGAFQDRALESRCLTEEMGHRKLRSDIPINLPASFVTEARALRNQLLSFRFRHYGRLAPDPALVDPAIEPRLNQVFVPLLSVIRDARARADLRGVLRDYQRQPVADRGLEVEAGLVEVLRDLQQQLGGGDLPLRDLTSRFIERHAEEMERKITPKWVGGLVRRRLGLRTVRSREGFVIPASEEPRLLELYRKYGLEAEVPALVSRPEERSAHEQHEPSHDQGSRPK